MSRNSDLAGSSGFSAAGVGAGRGSRRSYREAGIGTVSLCVVPAV